MKEQYYSSVHYFGECCRAPFIQSGARVTAFPKELFRQSPITHHLLPITPLFLFLLIFFLGLLPAQALSLILKSKAAVPGKEYFVSDLVQIKDGIPPEVLAVRMGPAPSFIQPALVTRANIEMALKSQAHFNDSISWDGATSCTVSRPSRLITSQDLIAVITPALARLTGGVGAFSIEEFSALSSMEIPAGHAQGAVELNPTAITNAWTNASVSFLVDGENVLTRSIRFRWTWIRDVWVAEHDLSAGAKIRSEDFKMARISALQKGNLLVSDPALFPNSVLAKPLLAGTPLAQADIVEKKLVYKGGKVMVSYAGNGLMVKIVAVALEDGVRGATIPVMNSTSHAQFLARVVDENSLEFVQAL